MWAGDVPDDRWSLVVYGDSTGLRYRNKESDPMPIKTLNNNGLKVYEETEDYFIQIDKDAVITTVEKYVPGTFGIYNERLNDVEKSRELLTLHKITWDANIDNAKLLLDTNNEQLEKLANTPTLLEDEVMPVLETRAIPTNYECCVRIDKKTGEMYIDEGYENLYGTVSYIQAALDSGGSTIKPTYKSDRWSFELVTGDGLNSIRYYREFEVLPNTTYNYTLKYTHSELPYNSTVYDKTNSYTIILQPTSADNFKFTTPSNCSQIRVHHGYEKSDGVVGRKLSAVNMQITENSTRKPFVKTIMPNGKMEFLSSATGLTHTFLTKGDGVITFGSGSFSLKGGKVLQLLVYKGLLTEQEKQAELAKDIRFRR